MSPASGNQTKYAPPTLIRPGIIVSIQLMSPASGNSEIELIKLCMYVSIQLMSPASGNL